MSNSLPVPARTPRGHVPFIAHAPGRQIPLPSVGDPPPTGRVAYVMSRFPKLTETFVLLEMLAVERTGWKTEIYPLLRERSTVMHPEAIPAVQRAHFMPFFSWSIFAANFYFLIRQPQRYLTALWKLMWGTCGSLNFFWGGLAIFPKAVAFARSMQRESVTHVHAHFCNHPAAAAFIIHQLTDIPYSFTAHGSDLHRDRRMLREKARDAEFVVTISQYNRDIIIAECGSEVGKKLHVVRCGVDAQFFHPETDRSGRNERSLQLICVGTLHEVKGQRFLIEACRLLRQRGYAVKCDFVGDGPDKQSLVELVHRSGLSDFVRLLGACRREEVDSLLRKADVAVAPSVPTADGRREGIPVALMEAMASETAVVASRLSGIPELIADGDNGLLVPPGDAAALATAIARLHDDPLLWRQLGRAGRATIERDYNVFLNAQRLAGLFRHEAAPTSTAAARRMSAGKVGAP